MQRTPFTLILTYALVGLIVAGGVVTFSEITSRVVPVFPKNGQLSVDFTSSSITTYEAPMDAAHLSPDNFTLDVTTDSIMVHRSGEFNVSNGWSTVVNKTRTVTIQEGKRTNLGSLTLPEGNVTMIRVSVVSATLERSPGIWENVRVPSGRLQWELPANAQIRAQSITHVVVDIHLVCPAAGCMITPVLHVED